MTTTTATTRLSPVCLAGMCVSVARSVMQRCAARCFAAHNWFSEIIYTGARRNTIATATTFARFMRVV